MTPDSRQPPSDAEIDGLLGSQLKRTSPEFEQRWRELRGQFVSPTSASRLPDRRSWLLWPGIVTAAFASALVVFVLRDAPRPPAPTQLVTFEELIALDSALASATPLLAAENREALIYLPTPANL
jgi:hypothetical protein